MDDQPGNAEARDDDHARKRSGPLSALLGLVMVVAVIAAAVLLQRPSVPSDDAAAVSDQPSSTTTTTLAAASIPVLGEAPELVSLDGWLQSDVTSLAELRGKVVVVEFWTFGCYNCKNTLPYLQDIAADHTGDPFEIVGVHSPEFDYEKDPDAIAEAADRLGVTWPIALDTKRKNFWGWQGNKAYWPRIYVIDKHGMIRFDHIGEGGYDRLAATVDALLAET